MKSKFTRFVLASTIIVPLACATAFAATYKWDASGTTPLDDGGGNWNPTGGTNWNTGTTWGVWGNTLADEAVFGVANGTAGTVTVGTVNANKLTFNAASSGNYTLTSGTITLGGTTPAVTATESATISSALNLSGSQTWVAAAGKTLTANGTLTRNFGSTINFSDTGTITGSSLLNLVGTTVNGWATYGGTDWAVSDGAKIAPLDLYTNDAWAVGNNTTVTISSAPAAGSTTQSLRFNTAAANTITLAGANTVASGILVATTVANNPTLITGGTLAGAAGKELVVIQANSGNKLTIASAIGDNVSATGLLKSGAGNLTLTGVNTFTGPTTISGGTLQIGDGATDGTIPGNITNNAALAYNLAGSQSYSGIISGFGSTAVNTGTLTFTGANTYTGATSINGGSVTFSTGGSTGGGTLALGTAAGSRAVLNMDSPGVLTHNNTVNVGGAGASANGAGALNQTAGTVNLMNNTGYMQLGYGGYGSYKMSGGTLNFTSASGFRIGDHTGGLGSFVQTGGTVNMTRYFVVAGNQGTAPSAVATISGGTLNGATGQWLIVGNGGTATGTLNVGTAAGGTGTIVLRQNNGITFGDSGTPTGTLNVNNGTIQFNAGVIRKATGTGVLNLNGGTLKANAAGLTLINDTLTSANVYNGGLNVDTQAFDTTISANLLATTGKGIYPAAGMFNLPSPDGAGYIGAPLVGVTTSGTGTGAMAVANIANGQVTGVTLTCPGQGYAAGDTVTFTFSGGGSTTAAAPFAYILTAADVVANGAGGLTKVGSGKLTLSGTNTFSGPINVTGSLSAGTLALNNTTLTVNGFSPTAAVPLQANTSFTTGGVVPVRVNGTFSAGTWPLIYYPQGGTIGGAGISALQLQTASLPRGVVATLVDNPNNASVDLDVTAFNPLTWKASVNGTWDINTTANWAIGTGAQKYLEGDIVRFDDSVGTRTTSVALNTAVAPQGVNFNNATKNYTLSGSGAISGTAAVVKDNTGTVTFLNANTYTGTTTVNGGTLQLGDGVNNGSISGPLENYATVRFNPAGTATYAGSLSGDSTGAFIKDGSGTLVITAAANASSGTFKVTAGTLQFGNGTVNGSAGSGMLYDLAANASLRIEQATAATPPWAYITGAGNVFLNSAQVVNGSANWGSLALSADYTGVLRVEKGRVDATGNTALGSAAKLQILSGAQFLGFTSDLPYTTPIEIAGTGWGETGFPGGLRLAAGSTATWGGGVTLTADSGIMAQRTANFTIAGPITGAYTCEFYAGDPSGDSGVLTVAPAAAVQNSYAATRINGRPNGSIVAGNPYAFSTGGLEVASAILKLNGNSLSFANLTGAGGAVGNYSTTTPATLTVGSDNTSTSYAGIIRDGDVAPLALVKTGTGTLTLTAAQTYTGDTNVAKGTLALATPSLADTSTVTISSGAVIALNTAASDSVGTLILGGVTVPAGNYGATHPVYGSFFSGTGSLVVGGAGYDSWAASKGLDGTPGKEKGLTDDPDRDGMTNLTEFYLNGNPLANDPSILPAGTVDATYLTFTFNRRDDAEADVASQFVQYGSTLTGWTNVPLGATSAAADANGVIVTVVENAESPDTINVRIPRALAPSGKLFGRLQLIK